MSHLIEQKVEKEINDGAAYFFGSYSKANQENRKTKIIKSRIASFISKYVWCDDYDTNLLTSIDIMKEFFRRRMPPDYRANQYQILCLGICSLISGAFSGTNGGVLQAGYYGYWISVLLSMLMYLGLAGSLVELCCTLPVVGGSFSYARAIVHNVLALVIGHVENVEYMVLASNILIGIQGYACEGFEIDLVYAPLVWIIILVPTSVMVTYCNRFTWNFFIFGVVLVFSQVLVFSIMGMVFYDQTQVTRSFPNDFDWAWGNGMTGIILALRNTSWWFTV